MRVLLDECVPRKFAQFLPGHECVTVPRAGWAGIKNGRLLALAEAEFDAFVTVDRNLSIQNPTSGLKIGVIIIKCPSNQLEAIAPLGPKVMLAMESLELGAVRVIE